MKKHLLTLILWLSCAALPAQHRIEKIWESDSTILNGPESATFDARSNTIYVSSMNAGAIVCMGKDGKFTNSNLVTGLHSNKGIGIFKGRLYTAETNSVAVIDIQHATIIKRIPVEGAVMLNDLAVDDKGNIYVSDTRTGKVHRIEGDNVTVYLENIPGANGLLTVGSDLYVVGSSTFQKADANKVVTKISEGFEAGLDGIVMVKKGEFVLSNYKGILYYVNSDGTNQILLDSRAAKIMSNDISYDPKSHTLFVPAFSSNRVIAYKLY